MFWQLKSTSKILIVFFIVTFVNANPKYEEPGWRRSQHVLKPNDTVAEGTSKDRLERLGFSTGYGSVNGYPYSGTGMASYNPVKIDVGGIIIGAIVGIGAVLLLPKILGTVSSGPGYYARSVDNDLSSLSDMMTKVDDILSQNNIDSTACMQRAFCSYVRSTEFNVKTGAADQMDELIHMLSSNPLVKYILNGTAIKEALEHGLNVNENDCNALYPSCTLDPKKASDILASILPKISQ